jgi:hypothetical protein
MRAQGLRRHRPQFSLGSGAPGRSLKKPGRSFLQRPPQELASFFEFGGSDANREPGLQNMVGAVCRSGRKLFSLAAVVELGCASTKAIVGTGYEGPAPGQIIEN